VKVDGFAASAVPCLNPGNSFQTAFATTATKWSGTNSRFQKLERKQQNTAQGSCIAIESNGEGLFTLACEYDLKGIVAKRKFDLYRPEHANWLKVRNKSYSQWVGPEELFERERKWSPDLIYWDNCVAAVDSCSVGI